jgi:glutamyl-tRNA synthetase
VQPTKSESAATKPAANPAGAKPVQAAAKQSPGGVSHTSGNALTLLGALRSKGEALLTQKKNQLKSAVNTKRAVTSLVVSVGTPSDWKPSPLAFDEGKAVEAFIASVSGTTDPEQAHQAIVLKQTYDRLAQSIGMLDAQIAQVQKCCPAGSSQTRKAATPNSQAAASKPSSPATSSSNVDPAWASFCAEFKAMAWPDACNALNQHLQSRTFMASRECSDVDQLAFDSIRQHKSFGSVEDLELEHPHLCRWCLHCEAAFRNAAPAASAAKSAKPTKQPTQEITNPLDLLKPLNNAVDGQVVTRFPPEPSGYLHLGHVKACLLNEGYARKYNGKLLFRLDDTNPEKEEQEFADSMLEDLESLGVKPDSFSATSDWFDQILEAGYQVLKDGKAYVDKTPQEKMQEERAEGIDSEYRNTSIEENLRLMTEMCKGTPEGLLCCVRGKMGMHHKNKALRDPVFFRCKQAKHHRLGDKWTKKIFPCYDFACPLVDSWEGVTHALRDSNYTDRDLLYTWVCDAVGVRVPGRAFFSRLNFVYCELSKRKLGKLVKLGLVKGWDDPRMPTVKGTLARGMSVAGLKQFIYEQASSLNITLQEWDKIWATNKAAIDPVVPRYTVIEEPVKVVLSGDGCPNGVELRSMPMHPKNPSVGEKVRRYTSTVWVDRADAESLKEGQEFTLVDWGNCIITKIATVDGEMTITATLNPTGDFKKTAKITWVSAMTDTVPCVLSNLHHLLAKKELEDGDEIEDCLREVTWTDFPAVGEHALRSLKQGDKMQIMRKGYFACYRPFISDAQPLQLICIPDGKTKAQWPKAK